MSMPASTNVFAAIVGEERHGPASMVAPFAIPQASSLPATTPQTSPVSDRRRAQRAGGVVAVPAEDLDVRRATAIGERAVDEQVAVSVRAREFRRPAGVAADVLVLEQPEAERVVAAVTGRLLLDAEVQHLVAGVVRRVRGHLDQRRVDEVHGRLVVGGGTATTHVVDPIVDLRAAGEVRRVDGVGVIDERGRQHRPVDRVRRDQLRCRRHRTGSSSHTAVSSHCCGRRCRPARTCRCHGRPAPRR